MERDDFDDTSETLETLEDALGGVGTMARAFDLELQRMRVSLAETGAQTGALSSNISSGLRRAFDGLIFDGMRLSDALRSVATSIVNATYSAAVRPVTQELGGLIAGGLASLGAAAFADGGVFTGGRNVNGGLTARVQPFARGGVVSEATAFPMRGGIGLMGEAGPEAIMPLARGRDGRLGVRADGGGRPVQVVMNVTTPDVTGFQRSQSQIATQLGRALSRGDRNR